eukprot:8338274-Karenia_brevis.AAC.1
MCLDTWPHLCHTSCASALQECCGRRCHAPRGRLRYDDDIADADADDDGNDDDDDDDCDHDDE